MSKERFNKKVSVEEIAAVAISSYKQGSDETRTDAQQYVQGVQQQAQAIQEDYGKRVGAMKEFLKVIEQDPAITPDRITSELKEIFGLNHQVPAPDEMLENPKA